MSHGFGTTDQTCLRGIKTGLQDLTVSGHQIVERIKTGLQDLTDKEIRSYNRPIMHTRYKNEAAGSHGFGTTDPTCLQGIRTGLQYLTGKEHQIVHA